MIKKWSSFVIDSVEHDGTDFTDLDASGSAILVNTFKQGTNFSNANFDKTKIHGGIYNDCNFENSSFKSTEVGHLEFNDCKFTNANFSGARLQNVVFNNCTFTKSTFAGTQFNITDLYDCKIIESVFNTELWYKGNIVRTEISKSEFNKSQFSGVLIDSVDLVDSSLLKATFFASQIQDSEFSNNAWLKVGFANGNSIYRTTLYNENIQQCNFSDSDWKENELQNSKLLKNDFSKIEIHDTDFVDTIGIGDNFATACIAGSKFVGCDFAGVNCTGTDFICDTSIQNCTLDKMIYTYAKMPKDFAENQLKKTSQAQIKPLEDKDLKIGYPSTKLNLISHEVPINLSLVGGSQETGTISLEGDIGIIDTDSPMSSIDLKAKKGKIETSAKSILGNALADISVTDFDVSSAKKRVTLSCGLGIFDLNIDMFKPLPNGFLMDGSLSSRKENINSQIEGNILDGGISIGFNISAIKNDREESASSYLNAKTIVGAVMLGASLFVIPELIPLAGIGLLVNR